MVWQSTLTKHPRGGNFDHALKVDSELPEKYDDVDFSAAGAESVVPHDIPDLFNAQFGHYSRAHVEDAGALMMQQFEIDCFEKTRGELPPELQGMGGSRILFLDGGGIRELVLIEVLMQLQQLTGTSVPRSH
jgi:hypothetical protein